MDGVNVSRITTQLKENLEKNNKYDDFVSSFKRCQTNTERVAVLYNLEEAKQLFVIEENFKPKCKREAEKLRANGNECFKSGNYPGAVSWYTQSIINAPDDSENLSLAYNNRSTANFYMKNYAQCLQDVELAFIHNYPTKSCYKLYQRIGRCMYYLCNKQEAIKAFQQTISALEKADLTEENRLSMIADMNKAIEQSSKINLPPVNLSIKTHNCCHQGIPNFSTGTNKEIPCLSDSVEVKLDSYGGRGLFAKQNIGIGEVLIVETPFATHLLKEFNLSHCQYCCNRVSLAIPCKYCSGVVFCSLECRNAAWVKFHWAECHILDSVQDKNLSLLAMRMIVTAGYDELIKIDEKVNSQDDLRTSGFDEEGIYNSEDYRSAYSLVNHADNRTWTDLLNRTISALYYLRYLEFVGFFSETITNTKKLNYSNLSSIEPEAETVTENVLNNKIRVGSHILRNLMMLPCNAHEISEFALNLETPAMSGTTELAAGAYPVLSLINHSCDPSVVRESYGNICVGRAIRSIRAGEELKDNYGALYPTMDLETRQRTLKSQYFFDCTCEACLGDWPLYFEIPCERPILRCQGCDGYVPIPQGNLTELAQCVTCGQSQDITGALLQMAEMEGAYKEALTSVIDGNNSQSNIKILLEYLKLIEKHIHRPWRDINDSQEAFKQCLNMHGSCYPVTKV